MLFIHIAIIISDKSIADVVVHYADPVSGSLGSRITCKKPHAVK